jgi:nicotinamidase/pyrazinamidase
MSKGILIVDPQVDFFPNGALAVPNGDEIIGPIKWLLNHFRGTTVYVTQDWHPVKTVHFKEYGGIWPPHCVQKTPGAEVHSELKEALLKANDWDDTYCKINRVKWFRKGLNPKDDGGYSAFDATGIVEELMFDGVESLIVCGLATDYCIKASVLEGLELDFEIRLFFDGIRAVNLEPDDGAKAIEEMEKAGAIRFNLGERI